METNVNASEALRQKRDELYRTAREHPGSPEDEMVEILLLSAMSKMDPAPYDATASRALGDERRRFQTARERRVHERRAQSGAEGTGSHPREAADEVSVAELRRELEKRQRRLEKIEEAFEAAKAARAAGKQMTDMEIYNRIAAVIGLTPPAEAAGPEDHRALPEGQHGE
jgi:hypothetical protein